VGFWHHLAVDAASGAAKAKELFFLADMIAADEAYRLGLVNDGAARQIVGGGNGRGERIAAGPSLVIAT